MMMVVTKPMSSTYSTVICRYVRRNGYALMPTHVVSDEHDTDESACESARWQCWWRLSLWWYAYRPRKKGFVRWCLLLSVRYSWWQTYQAICEWCVAHTNIVLRCQKMLKINISSLNVMGWPLRWQRMACHFADWDIILRVTRRLGMYMVRCDDLLYHMSIDGLWNIRFNNECTDLITLYNLIHITDCLHLNNCQMKNMQVHYVDALTLIKMWSQLFYHSTKK